MRAPPTARPDGLAGWAPGEPSSPRPTSTRPPHEEIPLSAATRPGIARRRVLAGLLLVPPALAGCAFGGGGEAFDGPDPLIALADAARADAALAAAAIAADPDLADPVRPLVDARTLHAAALDAEITRLDPAYVPAPAPTSPSGASGGSPEAPTLAGVRGAVLASGVAATDAVLELPGERVGLVASIAACCTTYGAVLS